MCVMGNWVGSGFGFGKVGNGREIIILFYFGIENLLLLFFNFFLLINKIVIKL